MRLRTANKHRKHAHRRAVLKAAYDFDMRQLAKGRPRVNTGYTRRYRARAKAWIKRATPIIASALDCPSRPWFRLEVP